MSFTGNSPSGTYKDILRINNSNTGVDGTARNIQSGEGTNSSVKLSHQNFHVTPSANQTDTVQVTKADGSTVLFKVDSTNSAVYGPGSNIVNTQYAYFGIGASDSANFASGYHHPIPFATNSIGSPTVQDNIHFNNSTEPSTTFTTAEGSATDASVLVPMLWFLPDAITIDSVTSFEGATAATGDTTRMHLFSYTFASGSTSALTSGLLLAHNSDVTNAGSEQAYKTTWTVDSANVAADKVIVAFFKSDSINSDYSVSIAVKYHLG